MQRWCKREEWKLAFWFPSAAYLFAKVQKEIRIFLVFPAPWRRFGEKQGKNRGQQGKLQGKNANKTSIPQLFQKIACWTQNCYYDVLGLYLNAVFLVTSHFFPLPHNATWDNTLYHTHNLKTLSKISLEYIWVSIVTGFLYFLHDFLGTWSAVSSETIDSKFVLF